MSNNWNNDTLPFQNKIVATVVPEDVKTAKEVIELIAVAFKCLYGLVIAIFGKQIYYIKVNDRCPDKVLEVAQEFNSIDMIYEHLDIVPFPK